ncbi:hypothetical protein EW145_g8334, partial [Phellinidium pouzarii]
MNLHDSASSIAPPHQPQQQQQTTTTTTTTTTTRTKSKAYQSGIAAGAEDVKYATKYRDLKKKVREIEAVSNHVLLLLLSFPTSVPLSLSKDNDKLLFKVLQAKRNIQRAKLERAILYERLGTLPASPLAQNAGLPPPPPPPPQPQPQPQQGVQLQAHRHPHPHPHPHATPGDSPRDGRLAATASAAPASAAPAATATGEAAPHPARREQREGRML